MKELSSQDEIRRREFYNEHSGEILAVFNARVSNANIDRFRLEKTSESRLIDWCAVMVSEIARRAGDDIYLRPGDPEFHGAETIDSL